MMMTNRLLVIITLLLGAAAVAVSGASITPVKSSLERIVHEWGGVDAKSGMKMRGKIETDIADNSFEETRDIKICFFENTPCVVFYKKLVSEDSFWYGETDAKTGFHGTANIAKSRHGRGRIYGSVNFQDTVYSISTRNDGSIQVDAIASTDFPPEGEADQIIQNSKNSNRPVVPHGRKLAEGAEDGSRIDVMVVYTISAMCADAGITDVSLCDTSNPENHRSILERLELAIYETNTAYTLSGVDTQLNLVHAYMDESYNEDSDASGDFSTMLSHVTNDNDGYVDEVHNLRDEYGADLVAMVIDASAYCGMAWMYTGDEANGFSVTAYGCATGYYSFGHEIGHNMGCNHDRVTSGVDNNTDGYAYGYWAPGYSFRTILGYNCPTSCPRIQRFSNSNTSYDYEGSIIGTEIEDNARQINDVRVSIANWRNSQEPTTQPTSSSNPTSSFSPTVSPTETQCKATCSDQTCDYWAQWSDCGCYNSGNSLELYYGCDCTGCDCKADVCSPPTTSPTITPISTITSIPTLLTMQTPTPTKTPTSSPTGAPTSTPGSSIQLSEGVSCSTAGCSASATFDLSGYTWTAVSLSVTNLVGNFIRPRREYADVYVNGIDIDVDCSSGEDCVDIDYTCLDGFDISEYVSFGASVTVTLDSTNQVDTCTPIMSADITIIVTGDGTTAPAASPIPAPMLSPIPAPTTSSIPAPMLSPTGTPTETPTFGVTTSATKAPTATPTSKPTLSCEDDMDCPTDNLYCKCYEYEPSTGRRKLLFGAIGGCDGYCVEKE